MRIDWKIEKKRGYARPLLTYTIQLEEHEKALCLPALRVDSSIHEPIDSWQEHCWPGQYERADPPQVGAVYSIDIPSHQGRHWEQSLRLPWRSDNLYPEVEETFQHVRARFEEEVSRACASKPMQVEGSLEASTRVKQQIACSVLAERLLTCTRKMSQAS